MTNFARILTGAAGIAMVAGAAAPAAAQSNPYYGQGYNSGGGLGAVINSILGGGRYGAYGQGNDRVAVDQCARAAEARVSHGQRASGYGNRNYPQAYGQPGYGNYPQAYGQPGYAQQGYAYNQAGMARVVGITAVQRSQSGLRVSGVIDSGRSQYRGGYGAPGYNSQGYAPPGYPNQGYDNQSHPYQGYGNHAQVADLRFSCRVDYRGQVTSLSVKRNVAARRGY